MNLDELGVQGGQSLIYADHPKNRVVKICNKKEQYTIEKGVYEIIQNGEPIVSNVTTASFSENGTTQTLYISPLCEMDLFTYMDNTTSMDKPALPQLQHNGLYIFQKIADTISQLHAKNIIHGDIKLDNILLKKQTTQENQENVPLAGNAAKPSVPGGAAPEYEPYLTDFGLSVILNDNPTNLYDRTHTFRYNNDKYSHPYESIALTDTLYTKPVLQSFDFFSLGVCLCNFGTRYQLANTACENILTILNDSRVVTVAAANTVLVAMSNACEVSNGTPVDTKYIAVAKACFTLPTAQSQYTTIEAAFQNLAKSMSAATATPSVTPKHERDPGDVLEPLCDSKKLSTNAKSDMLHIR
jgi:serine/threonine protein kinase